MTPSKTALSTDGGAPPRASGAENAIRPNLVRIDSAATSSSVNIEKLHAMAVKRRLRAESTPLSRLHDRFAGWMSSVVDCACCQDTTTPVRDEVEECAGTVATDGGTSLDGVPGGRGAEAASSASSGGGAGRRYDMRGGGSRPSPNTEKLRSRGIGGLSFEEISLCGTPRLSFERSVDGSKG